MLWVSKLQYDIAHARHSSVKWKVSAEELVKTTRQSSETKENGGYYPSYNLNCPGEYVGQTPNAVRSCELHQSMNSAMTAHIQ